MTTRQLPDCGELSSIFSSILRRWIGENMEEVRRRNKTEEYITKGCCATHDFCDANQAMLNALALFGITEYDCTDEALGKLIDEAWAMSKGYEFRY